MKDKFQTALLYVLRYAWVIILLVIAIFGREQFNTMIYRFTHWDEVVAQRGDRVLVQHLFVADRIYLEDPEEYSKTVELDRGVYFENVREGEDITLEQQRIVLENGDVYRHLSIPYSDRLSMSDIDTLKLNVPYRFSLGSFYFYDRASGEWTEVKNYKSGSQLPDDTLYYINFQDRYYVLVDNLYAYSKIEDGIYEYLPELTKDGFMNSRGGGWDLLMSFYNHEGVTNEFWTLESTEPLIDLDGDAKAEPYGVSERELVLKSADFGGAFRWMADGCYAPVRQGFTPFKENYYWRDPLQHSAALFAGSEGCRAAEDLGYVQMYLSSANIGEGGYYGSVVQDSSLYEQSGIKYGYMDVCKNAVFGKALAEAAVKYGESVLEERALKLADTFMELIAGHGLEFEDADGTRGLCLPAFYHYKGDIASSSSDAKTLRACGEFLSAAAGLSGGGAYSEAAEALLTGAELMESGTEPDFSAIK